MTIIERLWRSKIPVRLIILKARKHGISTLIEAIGFVLTITHKFKKMKVISYDEKSAKTIFEISKRYYENLPPDIKPPTKYDTKLSLVFKSNIAELSLGSQIDVDTGKKIRSGRGEDITILHISEMALMEYAKELLTSLRNAIPKIPDSLVAIESTAKGMGNDFHIQWEKASTLEEVLSGKTATHDKSEYVKIFIPWFEHNEYTLKAPPDYKLVEYEHPIYGNEVDIRERFKLTKNQMYWRRHTILNECDGDLDLYKQEYPSNPLEAFISSGRSRFAKIALANYMMKVKPAPFIGEVNVIETQKQAYAHYGGLKPTVDFFEDPIGNFKMWEKPKKYEIVNGKQIRVDYVIGVDVSEGLQVDKRDTRKTDWSVVSVWKRIPYMKVAQWRGKIDPDMLGTEIVYPIGWYYNLCWIGVENNNHGFTTNKALQRIYPRLYYEIDLDERTNEETRKFGWSTTQTTKPYMIDCLASLVREEKAIIYDDDTIKEYQTYIIFPDGHQGAQHGNFDDIVMADAIALQVHKNKPFIRNQDKFESPLKFGYER